MQPVAIINELAQCRDVGRRRSATTADDASPGFQDGTHGLCESCGIDIVDRGTVFGDAWESRIGLHHERAAGVRGHLRDERRDLAWAERAVDANGRGTERGERGGGNGGFVPMKVRPSSPKVIVTKTGNGVLSRQASSAALASSRSAKVSRKMRSQPAAQAARACSAKIS